MLWLDHFLFAGGLPTLSVLAWWGLDALRGHWQFRHSFTRDVTQSAPGPAPATELMINRLSRLGFERPGVTRSGRPILGERVTAWVLVDPGRTSIAEITLLAGQRNAICAFSSILGDGTILSTSHGYGFDVRKRELVAQPVPTGPEDAWRHQESLDELRPRHGVPVRLHGMADVIRYAAMARARFSTHGFGRDRWMFAGWAAGGLIVWGAIGMTAAQGFGTFNLDTWLADMRWPMITGLGVAALASLANYRRLLQPA